LNWKASEYATEALSFDFAGNGWPPAACESFTGFRNQSSRLLSRAPSK